VAVVRLVRVDSYNVTPDFKDVGVACRALPRPPPSKVRTQGEVRAVTVTARLFQYNRSISGTVHAPRRTTMNPTHGQLNVDRFSRSWLAWRRTGHRKRGGLSGIVTRCRKRGLVMKCGVGALC